MNAPDFLVESIPNGVHGLPDAPLPRLGLAFIFPAIISAGVGWLCYMAAGVSLGLFLGALILIGLIAGPLMAAEETWLGRALAAVGIIHGVVGVWLYATIRGELDLGLWAASYLVLATMVLAIGGLTALLQSWRIGRIGSGAIVTGLMLAWLTWPLWLSPALHGPRGDRIVAWLVPAHPIFAVNGVLRERLGYWAEHGIAYNLTSLGDDIAYSVPDNVLKCMLAQLGVAVACAGLAMVRRRRR